MNIENVAAGDNDLARFMSFLNHIDDIQVIKEDWDNMCGITVATNYSGTENSSICFNFYEDGKYRTIIAISDENKRDVYRRSRNEEFKYASFWDVLKIWWQAKGVDR